MNRMRIARLLSVTALAVLAAMFSSSVIWAQTALRAGTPKAVSATLVPCVLNQAIDTPVTGSSVITCGGLTFSNFQVANPTGGAAGIVDILAGSDYNTTTGAVYLNLNPNLGAQNEDEHLLFAVSGGLKRINISIGGSNATITERVCANPIPTTGSLATECTDSTGTIAVAPLAQISVASGDPNQPIFSAPFTPTSPVYIFKDIKTGPGTSQLSEFTESFEPGVLPCPADTFKVNYFSNAQTAGAPDATVYLTNPGTSGGNICAMIYVVNPSQQLLECCGCPISPDGLLTLSVNSNLTSNPLTPETLTSGTIKVISSTGAPNCDPSKPVPTPAVRGWGTHIQSVSTGVPSPYRITETDFQDAKLCSPEVGHLESICSSILNNGSAYGVCSCGALTLQ